jgi:hypothetical protein
VLPSQNPGLSDGEYLVAAIVGQREMRVAVCGALVCLVMTLVGCFGGGGQPSEETTPTERGQRPPQRDIPWLGRLRQWDLGLNRDWSAMARTASSVKRGTRSMGDLRKALRRVASCPATLRSEVGKPATPRYDSAIDLLTHGCDLARRWALKALNSQTVSGVERAGDQLDQAVALFELAHDDLEATFLSRRQLPTIAGRSKLSRIEPRLSGVAGKLVNDAARSGVEVHCWSNRQWRVVKEEWGAYSGRTDLAGFARPLREIHLAPRPCATLVDFLYRRRRPSSGRALALAADSIGLLAHESQHLIDDAASEAETECRGMQNIRHTARLLGASTSYADLVANLYWSELYPLEPVAYRTAACRDGGPLDANPGSKTWP